MFNGIGLDDVLPLLPTWQSAPPDVKISMAPAWTSFPSMAMSQFNVAPHYAVFRPRGLARRADRITLVRACAVKIHDLTPRCRRLARAVLPRMEGRLLDAATLDANRRQGSAVADAMAQSFVACRLECHRARARHTAD